MNAKDKFLKTIEGENHDIPIFNPAIYDYKVNFSNTSINVFGQSESELIEAIEKEIDLLQSEVVTCGYDIYNIEAEALGAKIVRENEDIFPEIMDPLIKNLNEIDNLPVLNELAGRMPLFINATKSLSEKYHDSVYVRGAVSGPFSLAGRLYSNDQLIVDCILNPQGVYQLLEYCTDSIITHLRGYIDEKQDVVIFDSLSSPPLISPEIYSDLILPFHQRIFKFLKDNGVQIRPLIMGGNTLPIMDNLTKTGANQYLLDYIIPLKDIKSVFDQYNFAFRINLDPALVAQNNQNHIVDQMEQIFKFLGHRPNLIIGTGILLKNTPLENIRFIRDFIVNYYSNIFK